jgi:hypothetical protein
LASETANAFVDDLWPKSAYLSCAEYAWVIRLYWPKDTPPSILPPGEGSGKPPAVMRAQ